MFYFLFFLFLPLKQLYPKKLFMCCEGGHSSFLCLCSHLMFVLLLHVLCWGTALSLLSSCCFLLFLLPPLKYIFKKQKNVQPDVCRGGGHGSFLFLFYCLCFFFPMCHVGAWLFCVSKLITGFNTIP